MKKKTRLISTLFAVIYAVLISLGFECWISYTGIAVSFSSEGYADNPYPHFIPFCIIVGLVALAILIALVFLNVKISYNQNYTKRLWIIQVIASFVMSIPLIKPWEMLFDFLRKTF